ncbi:MAG: hypothetical protein JWO83_1607, partial [Caulobacteraceae bacterium]|nr:hypothetical protein [Caulobacteraceae bacterium]
VFNSAMFQDNGIDNFGPTMPLWAFNGLHQTNNAVNYRAVLNYQPTNEILVYGGVTSGFKSGDFSGGFLSSNPVEAARQLAPVLPEKVTDLEIGLKSTFLDRRLLVDLSAFYNIYRDEQVFIILPPISGGSGLQLPVLDNAPKSHTDGVELEVVAKPLEGLTLTTNAAWLEARIDQFSSSRSPAAVDYTGHTLPLAPKYSFSGIIDYRRPIGLGIADFQFQASYRSMQHFDLTNNPWTSQGAYWLSNMRLGYLFDNNRVEAAVFVHNLFGKQYLNFANDNTNPFGQIEDVVGAPRSVGVSIDYRY